MMIVRRPSGLLKTCNSRAPLKRNRNPYSSSLAVEPSNSNSINDADSLAATLKDLSRVPEGRSAQVHGWIRSLRHHKSVSFAMIYDGSLEKDLQAVLSPEQASALEIGAAARLFGKHAWSKGVAQEREFLVQDLAVLGRCPADAYPIQNKPATLEFLRSIPHLRPRTANFAALLKLRSSLAQNCREFLASKQFTELHAPCIVFSDCEGGSESFELKDGENTFERRSYLSVSAQLHAEIGATSIGRVYTFGPIFRAEKHNTSRHLSEFLMLEAEIPFTSSIQNLMSFAEDFIVSSAKNLLLQEEFVKHFPNLQKRVDLLVGKAIARITYTEAIGVLKERQNSNKVFFENPIEWGKSLQSEHERYLTEVLINGPLFVYDYPAAIKAFYMKGNDSIDTLNEWKRSTVGGFDLLLPHVAEVMGGSVREDSLEKLERALQYHKLDRAEYEWYLDLRRFGSVPHGGLGLGFDLYRVLGHLCPCRGHRDRPTLGHQTGLFKQFHVVIEPKHISIGGHAIGLAIFLGDLEVILIQIRQPSRRLQLFGNVNRIAGANHLLGFRKWHRIHIGQLAGGRCRIKGDAPIVIPGHRFGLNGHIGIQLLKLGFPSLVFLVVTIRFSGPVSNAQLDFRIGGKRWTKRQASGQRTNAHQARKRRNQ